jgi:hypothetical protein
LATLAAATNRLFAPGERDYGDYVAYNRERQNNFITPSTTVLEFKRIIPAAERIGALAELIEIFQRTRAARVLSPR